MKEMMLSFDRITVRRMTMVAVTPWLNMKTLATCERNHRQFLMGSSNLYMFYNSTVFW